MDGSHARSTRGDRRTGGAGRGGSSEGDRSGRPRRTSRVPPPDPEVPAKVQRRRFSAEYRLRMLKQADACKKPGEMGALLRREGLYSSLLTNWRRQREQGALQDLRARRRGPKPRSIDPRVTQLEAENRRLHRKLQRAWTPLPCRPAAPPWDQWARSSWARQCRSASLAAP